MYMSNRRCLVLKLRLFFIDSRSAKAHVRFQRQILRQDSLTSREFGQGGRSNQTKVGFQAVRL